MNTLIPLDLHGIGACAGSDLGGVPSSRLALEQRIFASMRKRASGFGVGVAW